MTLDEAIKILTKERNDHHSFPTDIIGKAEQLGIEAMKVIRDVRPTDYGAIDDPLPGETED